MEFQNWSEKTSLTKNHRCQNLDKESGTVLKAWGSGCKESHVIDSKNNWVRKLEVEEIAEIQTFPFNWFDNVALSSSIKINIIGNAVPSRFAEAICLGIKNAFPGAFTTFSSLEICAGGGGLALGAHNAGFHSRLMVEFWDQACQVLSANKSTLNFDNLICDDVKNVDFIPFANKIDFLLGGPPCQPFSTSGKHKGEDDERDLFGEMDTLLKKVQPNVFMLENVPGLLTMHKTYFTQVVQSFEDAGYDVAFEVLNALDYGVPQRRKRLLTIGIKKSFGLNAKQAFVEIKKLQPDFKNGRNASDHPLSTVREVVQKINLPNIKWKKIRFQGTI
jgi:site-specific DNA-cytosine methylase